MSHAAQRTAFVFAGGGSLGAVQVGMLHELMHAGVSADLVLGSSVGAMNAAYFAVLLMSRVSANWKRFGADCGDVMCFQ
jgi:predicted acylesterase/phospholipase RssA